MSQETMSLSQGSITTIECPLEERAPLAPGSRGIVVDEASGGTVIPGLFLATEDKHAAAPADAVQNPSEPPAKKIKCNDGGTHIDELDAIPDVPGDQSQSFDV